jgi:hypothetical protein
MLDLQAHKAMSPANPSAASGTPCPPAWRCQTSTRMSSAVQTMAFKNEVVSDADIDRYNLPFQKGDGRWWTRDAARDYYLWGGLSGNPAYGTEQEGRFYLYVDGNVHFIIVFLTENLNNVEDFPRTRNWQEIARIVPEPDDFRHKARLGKIIKEALNAYGYDGQNDDCSKDVRVVFGF